MRRGFTTGTAAAAAAKAEAYHLTTRTVCDTIDVSLPDGSSLTLPVQYDGMFSGVIKDGGDDVDATSGLLIQAEVTLNDTGVITIHGGTGVGIVTRPGLSIPEGEAAINPVPRKMIEDNVRAVIGTNCGASVTIHIPDGEATAEKTFNARLGIIGGISVIGTTGIVEPMSIDALKATIACEINIHAAESTESIWLVPGKIGEKALKRAFGEVKTVQMSNFVGYALEYAYEQGFRHIGIAGHPGKLAKIPMGYYATHSKESPQAQDYVAELLGLDGTFNTVEEIVRCTTRDQMNLLAKTIAGTISGDFAFDSVRVVLFSMEGTVVGEHE